MDGFIAQITAYPTLIYTILLAGMFVLLLPSLLGFLELDIGEVDIEGGTDSVSGFAGLLVTLGLSGVPITISFSLLFLFAWAACYVLTAYLSQLVTDGIMYWIVSIIILVVSFFVGVWITSKLVKPLRRFFHQPVSVPRKYALIGKTCTVRSSRVNATMGEAVCKNDSADLIIKVRADVEYLLKKGDRAIITEHDEDGDFYHVMPTSVNE